MTLRGYNVKVGYYEETSFGTKPDGTDTAPITYSPPGAVSSFAFTVEPELVEIYALGSRDLAQLLRGRKTVKATLKFYPVDLVFVRYGIDNISKSFTIWGKLLDINDHILLLGGKIDGLTIDVAEGEVVTISADIIAKTSDNTPPTYADVGDFSGTPLMFKDVSISKDGTSITSKVKDFSLKIDNNLEPVFTVSSDELVKILEKNREISGTIGMSFESMSEYSEVVNDTEFSLSITMGGNTINLSGCKWEKFDVEITPEDLIYLPMSFRAKSITVS